MLPFPRQILLLKQRPIDKNRFGLKQYLPQHRKAFFFKAAVHYVCLLCAQTPKQI